MTHIQPPHWLPTQTQQWSSPQSVLFSSHQALCPRVMKWNHVTSNGSVYPLSLTAVNNYNVINMIANQFIIHILQLLTICMYNSNLVRFNLTHYTFKFVTLLRYVTFCLWYYFCNRVVTNKHWQQCVTETQRQEGIVCCHLQVNCSHYRKYYWRAALAQYTVPLDTIFKLIAL